MQKVFGSSIVIGVVFTVVFCAFPAFAQIEINTIEELQLIGNDPGYPLDGDYVLGNDIDASVTVGWNNGAGFVPIAPDTDPKDPYNEHNGPWFSGTFNGQGYTITGLVINRPEEYYIGLFSASGGVIQNVILENVDVSGLAYVGALSGNGGQITNCGSTGTVSGITKVGGLKGNGVVQNCYSACTVSGTGNEIGGLVGYGSATNCYSMGNVSGRADIGGLVGYAYSAVTNCYSTGNVSGSDKVGGLVGYTRDDITDCYSTGNVSGSGVVGGLVGSFVGGGSDTIMNCYSTGDVSSDRGNVGGLVGVVQSLDVTNCYSTAKVSGSGAAGGLMGTTVESNITDCYSTGVVSGTGSVGGLIGFADTNSIATNCYWDMERSDKPYPQAVLVKPQQK